LNAYSQDAIAALEVIAEMDGKCLIYDPAEEPAVRAAYSLGSARAFAQAASVAKTVLSQQDKTP
jgi:hypothetical protein